MRMHTKRVIIGRCMQMSGPFVSTGIVTKSHSAMFFSVRIKWRPRDDISKIHAKNPGGEIPAQNLLKFSG